MAHKGRDYRVRQTCRQLAGNVNWPNYPAMNYTLPEGDGTYGIAAGVPWPVPLDPPDPDFASTRAEWWSPLYTLSGMDVQFALVIWGPGQFLSCSFIHQIFVDGLPQYEEIYDGFEPIGNWQFPTNLGSLMTPTAGAVAGWNGLIQSRAVLWP